CSTPKRRRCTSKAPRTKSPRTPTARQSIPRRVGKAAGTTAEPSGPVRTCVGCRRTAATSELVRLARRPDGELAIGAGPGRGAWLCRPPAATACLDEAQRRGALARALRTAVGDDEVQRVRAKLGA